jgi:uncharacterized protein YjbI with pentapeptide repeats
VVFRAAAFLAVDLRAVDFLAVDLRAVDFLAVDLRAVDFFAADLRAGALFAVDLRAVDLRAVDFFAADLRGADFFAVDLRAVDFLAVDFLAVDFLAVALRAELFFLLPDLLREDPERELELREPERDEDLVVAGTARATSELSSLARSPIAASPHVSSAASGAVDDSLSESTLNGLTVSPIPLQSSWVINDLLRSDCACTIPYHVGL